MADIKEGTFLGSAAMPQPDGTQKALEVHIFPEAMRGTGEGHRPFNIPGSTMTNGTAAGATVTSVDGAAIKVKYKDGEKKIIVPPNVPIVRYEIGSAADLKPGAAFTDHGRDQEAGRHARGRAHQRRPRRHGAAVDRLRQRSSVWRGALAPPPDIFSSR